MSEESKQAARALLARGLDLARAQERPSYIVDDLQAAILALERDDHEELVRQLVGIGYAWRMLEGPTEAELRAEIQREQAAELREQRRRAGQQKRGKTKRDPTAVLARVEELRGQSPRLQEQQIDDTIKAEFGIARNTWRGWAEEFGPQRDGPGQCGTLDTGRVSVRGRDLVPRIKFWQ